MLIKFQTIYDTDKKDLFVKAIIEVGNKKIVHKNYADHLKKAQEIGLKIMCGEFAREL